MIKFPKKLCDQSEQPLNLLTQQDMTQNILSNSRLLYLNDVIEINSVQKIIDKMNILKMRGDAPIHIYIGSEGGDPLAAFALAREIEYSTIPVFTYIPIGAFSAATIVFLSGHIRIMYPESFIMFHGMKNLIEGTHQHIMAQYEFTQQLNKKIFQYYKEKTKLTETEIENILRDNECWFMSEVALEKGICDLIFNGCDVQPIYQKSDNEFSFAPIVPDYLKDKVRKTFEEREEHLMNFVEQKSDKKKKK